MLMDVMDDCKISHMEVDSSRQILCEVVLLKAIESPRSGCYIKARQARM